VKKVHILDAHFSVFKRTMLVFVKLWYNFLVSFCFRSPKIYVLFDW